MPRISALGKLRQENKDEFEASLSYKVNFRPSCATILDSISKTGRQINVLLTGALVSSLKRTEVNMAFCSFLDTSWGFLLLKQCHEGLERWLRG